MTKRPSETVVETHTVHRHQVELRKHEGTTELWIDGKRRRFFATRDGYTLHDDAYAPPEKTLLDAVRAHLKPKPRRG